MSMLMIRHKWCLKQCFLLKWIMDPMLTALMMKQKELLIIRLILSADKIYLIDKIIIQINSRIIINLLINMELFMNISRIGSIKMMIIQYQQKMMEVESIRILDQEDQKINHLNHHCIKIQTKLKIGDKNLHSIMMKKTLSMKLKVDNIHIHVHLTQTKQIQ